MKNLYVKSILLTLSLFAGNSHVSSKLIINEFMVSNTGMVLDPEYKKSADWIEFFNNGNSPIDLGGYYLTDNLKKPTKWQIPAGIQISAHGYILFWADDMNTGHHTNFALSASSEQIGLSDKSGTLIDSVEYGAHEPNVSMGRKPDGSSDWVFFTAPTPGAPNSTVNYSDIVRNDPDFSIAGGIYHNTISIEIKSIFGGDVRYTIDGTEPNELSSLANAPISITKNTVVRARIFKPGQIPGLVSTNTYLIDTENKINKLPIVCLSSAPDNLWAADSGIYVQRNVKSNREIPINIELFENDGRDGAAFNKRAGAKLNGLYSWQLPEKMLGIYFRKSYSSTKLEYPWILDKRRTSYGDFSLRASGSDWGNTMFRDAMVQTAAVENTNIDISGFRPCVAYINGEFIGIYNIREKIDESYIVGNYGLQPGAFDMIEKVDSGQYVETGDITANNYLISLLSKDLTDKANFDAIAAEMDIKEFTEMVCTEVYSGNNSISHDLMKWKPKGTGKWRWILMDLDCAFLGANNQMISFYINQNGWPLKDLMRNPDYKKQFGRKLSDLLFTTFNPKRMVSRIEDHKKAIEADMPEQIKRWAGTSGTGNYSSIKAISSMDNWLSEVEVLKTFAQERPGVILNDLTNYGFQSPVPVTVSTIPAKAGSLTFNGLKIPIDVCSGGYPKGEEIKLTAQAKAGYTFLGWKTNSDSVLIGREDDYISTEKELVINPQTTVNVSAIFEADGNSILPAEISSVMTLSKACSPYFVPDNVNITSTGKLIIEPGVQIWMSDGVSIFSAGPICAKGTKLEPIIFKSNPESVEKKWGLIHIKNANDTVWFKNIFIENASEGPNPVRDLAALAIDNSTVMLDSITIENVFKNPLSIYNCQTKLTNSIFHSEYAGCELINIKRGKISILNCEFIGNKGEDTDGLDFGYMSEINSSVRNCYFHDFEGFNADAVDLGDHTNNFIVDNIIAYNINDKGVSVGQCSSTKITNSVFINCGMGAGMKDSSSVEIDHCTYYGNFLGLANYQKHAGDAGSNLVVSNSILSNSYELGYFNDEFSKGDISNSSDDTEKLPDGKNNLEVNPLFKNPVLYDFPLLSGSPLIGSGTHGKTIGANLKLPKIPASVMISDIAYKSLQSAEDIEFIGLYNPGDSCIQLDSCTFSSGIQFTFPTGASIGAKEKIYITLNAASSFWDGKDVVVYQWESGRLSDQGEKIQLMNKYGMVIDQVIYGNNAPWPVPQDSQHAISLSSYTVDNHFGEYWKLQSISEIASVPIPSTNKSSSLYPNPSTGVNTVSNLKSIKETQEWLKIKNKENR